MSGVSPPLAGFREVHGDRRLSSMQVLMLESLRHATIAALGCSVSVLAEIFTASQDMQLCIIVTAPGVAWDEVRIRSKISRQWIYEIKTMKTQDRMEDICQ